MKKIGVTFLMVLWIALLSACRDKMTTEERFLKDNNLDGKTVVQMIEYLDQLSVDRPLSFQASVTATTLYLKSGTIELSYSVGNLFYLSVAPYFTNTHPCSNHSLATCQGELVLESFTVFVYDSAGDLILETTKTTYHNGFFGIWLPRDLNNATIEIRDENGYVAIDTISTTNTSKTCLTTLKLE